METERLKIAFVSDSIYPFNKGGKETRSYELACQLSKRGHEVHFYTMNFWEGETKELQPGFFVHGICKNHPLYLNKRRSIKQGLIFGLSAFKLLKEDFDVIDADHMVYFHLWPTKLACLIKRKPLIITWHEVWGKDYWKSYMGKKGSIGYWMEKMSSKLPNKIISISKHTTKNLIEKLNVPKEKIVTIPNAIDYNQIQSVKADKEKSDVIFAGRLLSHKNIDILIKSVKRISLKNPKLKCIIVGDGPERKNLEKLVKELKLEKNVKFTGFLEDIDEVTSLIKSSKVFVLPSTREGFGIVVIHANACGVPVIVVNHKDNASKDLIYSKNGFVCELDEKSLAESIIKMIKTSNGMAKGCKEEAKKFDWDNLISKFEEVYTG